MDRVWLLALLIGCVPPQPQPSYYGQQQGQGGAPGEEGYAQQGQQPAAGLSCMQLFQCFQACADGTCIQTCLGQADPATQQAASAMLQCNGTQCQDGGSDCLQTECAAELEACQIAIPAAAPQQPQQPVAYEQPAEQLAYPDQPHTTANLLPWMTGQWIGNNAQFEFYGDGRVKRAMGNNYYSKRTGSYACVSTVQEMGTVRQEGDLLIMDFAPAASNHCGDKDTGSQGTTVRYRITWYKYSELPTILKLIDIDCDHGPMYCNEPMKRR